MRHASIRDLKAIYRHFQVYRDVFLQSDRMHSSAVSKQGKAFTKKVASLAVSVGTKLIIYTTGSSTTVGLKSLVTCARIVLASSARARPRFVAILLLHSLERSIRYSRLIVQRIYIETTSMSSLLLRLNRTIAAAICNRRFLTKNTDTRKYNDSKCAHC